MTGPRAFIAIPAVFALVALALPFARSTDAPDRWWRPGEGRDWPAQLNYENALGSLRVLLANGPLATKRASILRTTGTQWPRLRHLSSASGRHEPVGADCAFPLGRDTGARSIVRRHRRLELPESSPG